MCSINHDKKAIYIHIPKNGGSYIAEILSKHYGFQNFYLKRPDHKFFCKNEDYSVDKHENKLYGTLFYYRTSNYINKIMNMNEKKWNSYFIFTFTRNPYDRVVSGWNYCNKKNISFKNYLNLKNNVNSYDYWHVFMTQANHIFHNPKNNKINLHFIGKLENLEEDLKIALNKIGIHNIYHTPSKKNSKQHNNFKNYYDDQSLEKVNILFKEDFFHFDYPMVFSSNDL
jgi:hypothetical protein